MTRPLRPFQLATLLASVACGSDATGPENTPDRPAVLGLEDITFRPNIGPEVPAQFGRLWLTGGAGAGAGAGADGLSTQSLAFVRLLTTAAEPGPAIVFLAGGPGGSGIQAGRGGLFQYFRALLSLSDVILLDQRGTGSSTPRVACDQEFAVPTDRAIDRAGWSAVWVGQAGACADELRARGVNLDEYNSSQSADDIEALREAVGAEQLILVGHSYGTHLALAYIRRYEDRVAAAVLHGVEGPDHTLKLPSNVQRSLEVIDSLAGDPSSFGIRIEGFLALLETGLRQLEAKPDSAMVGDTLVVISKFDAQVLIANSMGDRDEVEKLPLAVVAVLEGGWGLIAPAILEFKRLPLNSGMTFAMDCASGATQARLARIAAEAPNTLLGDAINFPFPEICQGWGVPDLGDGFRAPITSDVPVLFISGTIDGRTPPGNATEVAAGFANGRHLIVELAGHDELAADQSIIDAVLAFLSGQGTVPERIALPPLRFRLPS